MIVIKNVIFIVENIGSKIYICYVFYLFVVEEIRKVKLRGVNIIVEICIYYLIFIGNDLIENGMLFKCFFLFRSGEVCDSLWEYICDGILDCICFDYLLVIDEEKVENELGVFGVWGGLSGV